MNRLKIKISKDALKYLYLDKKLSSRDIAEEFACNKPVILDRLHRYNIPVREAKRMRSIDIPKAQLKYLYISKKLSIYKIAERFGTNPATIHKRLHEYDVPIRSISEALKGKIPWNKGRPPSEETRKKISKISKEFWENPDNEEKIKIRNKKLSESKRGDGNPMKRPEVSKKVSEAMKGKLVGDKNPAKKLEVRKKLSQASKGHAVSPETRKKISEALYGRYKGKDNPFYGKRHTKEVKEKNRIKAIQQLTSGKFNNRITSIELKMEKTLRKSNIYYKQQFPLENITVVDFYLPQYRVAIYCDGTFWHKSEWTKRQGVIAKDKKQNKILTANGYKVFRFAEKEINDSTERCVDKIVKYINKI